MLLYNVVASRAVDRPGGTDFYPSVVNPHPVDVDKARDIMAECQSRGICCRLEEV